MLTIAALFASVAMTPRTQEDALWVYTQSAAHTAALEWFCGTGQEAAVRSRALSQISRKVSHEQTVTLTRDFDEELARFGYKIKDTESKRWDMRFRMLKLDPSLCDRELLDKLKADEPKRMSWVDHPETMPE